MSDAFQLNTTYRIIAQIRDSAAGPDSLDFVTELFAVKSGTSGVGDGSRLTPGAAKIAITAASPNPFNPTLELSFTNRAQADLDLEIYDISGKQVRVIHLGSTAAGDHTVRWSGGDNSGRQVSSGVYLMRVTDGRNYSQMTKVALVR